MVLEMGVKFSFWAYGILAIAALALVLYAFLGISGFMELAKPLLNIAIFIVIAFIIYMFAKPFLRRYG